MDRVGRSERVMIRRIAMVLVCLTPGVSFGQPPLLAPDRDLERLYHDVIDAYVGDGGLCKGRTAAVEQKQRALAGALSNATVATAERVLLFAVTANSLADVVRLNEAGAPRTGDNGSLLHTAARFAGDNRRENAQWLIQHGADVNATDRGGAAVLRHSLVCRNQELVDYLVEAGAIGDEESAALADKMGLVLRAR